MREAISVKAVDKIFIWGVEHWVMIHGASFDVGLFDYFAFLSVLNYKSYSPGNNKFQKC